MTVNHARVIAGSGFVLLARVLDGTGHPITVASVAAVEVDVVDVSTQQATATLTPAIVGTVFDTPQVDARWSADAVGYNLALPIPGSAVPTGDRTYAAVCTVTPVGGLAFKLVWRVQTADPMG